MHRGTPATRECTREQRGEGKRGLPTVHDDFNNAEVDLAPGHEAPLARVRALVGLLYAADLKMIVTQLLKPN